MARLSVDKDQLILWHRQETTQKVLAYLEELFPLNWEGADQRTVDRLTGQSQVLKHLRTMVGHYDE